MAASPLNKPMKKQRVRSTSHNVSCMSLRASAWSEKMRVSSLYNLPSHLSFFFLFSFPDFLWFIVFCCVNYYVLMSYHINIMLYILTIFQLLPILPSPASRKRRDKVRKSLIRKTDREWWDSVGLMLSDGQCGFSASAHCLSSSCLFVYLFIYLLPCAERKWLLHGNLFYEAWKRFLICLCPHISLPIAHLLFKVDDNKNSKKLDWN